MKAVLFLLLVFGLFHGNSMLLPDGICLSSQDMAQQLGPAQFHSFVACRPAQDRVQVEGHAWAQSGAAGEERVSL